MLVAWVPLRMLTCEIEALKRMIQPQQSLEIELRESALTQLKRLKQLQELV